MTVPLVLALIVVLYVGYKTKGWALGVAYLGAMIDRAGTGVPIIDSPVLMGIDMFSKLGEAIGSMFGKKAEGAAVAQGLYMGLVQVGVIR